MNSRPKTSKVLLVSEGRATDGGAAAVAVRRYRIARIRPENRPAARRSPDQQ